MRRLAFVYIIFVAYLIYFRAERAKAGECCLTYYDALNTYYGEQWCPNYCCQDPNGRLYCCSDPWRKAPGRYRYGYCSAWWTYRHNLWAPIVIAIVLLAICIGICVCCFRFCCVCF